MKAAGIMVACVLVLVGAIALSYRYADRTTTTQEAARAPAAGPTTMTEEALNSCWDQPPADRSQQCSDDIDEHIQALQRTRPRRISPTTTRPPARPKISGIEFGQHRVGTDIQPGRRTFEIEAPWDRCYWERLSGFSGEFDDIIANEHETGRRFTVDIKPTDAAFEIRCYDHE